MHLRGELTTTQNVGEKNIEYCQLKTTTFAEEGTGLSVVVLFPSSAFPTGHGSGAWSITA